MNSLRPRDAWRTAVISIATILLLTFILYQQTILYLIGIWNQLEIGNYGHGYLVLMISAYLVFYNRRRLVALTPCPEYRAMWTVIAASMLWMVAALVDIEMLQTVGLLLLVLSVVWALLGSQVTKILVFPVLYIGFAIPIWFPLSPILQDITADVVFWIIRVMEIPALRIENMIVLPAGKLSIEEACGGLNYFVAALTLGTFYAYLNYTTFYTRLVVVLVSASAAVLVNVLRVFIVVYLGFTTDMQHPLIKDHLSLGWFLFGGLVLILLAFDVLLQRRQQHSANEERYIVTTKLKPCAKSYQQFVVFALAVALFVSLGPATIFWSKSQPNNDTVQISLITTRGEWLSLNTNEDDWAPQYRGAITQKMVFHDNSNHEVHLFLGIYPVQNQGEELINDLNRISDDKIWHIKYQRAKVYNVNGQQVLEQLLEKNDGTQRLVWYWYRVAGQNAINKYEAKALQVLGILKGMRQASVVGISTNLDGEPEGARKILGQFVENMGSSIDSVIDSKI